MFPSSRPHNSPQHVQRTHFPSIIRTRSQQQRPLAPIDMYASPFKEAIRNRNHTTHRVECGSNTESVEQQDAERPHDNTEVEVTLSPPYKKRASSPSFSRNDHAGKRIRVLGQSSKMNSLSRRHSEESLGTPRKDSVTTPGKASPAPMRPLSCGSPGKGMAHIDLTKAPPSPMKQPGSPTKTFKITTGGGHVMRVPVTPSKGSAKSEGAIRTPGAQANYPPSTPQHNTFQPLSLHLSVHPPAPMQPSTPIARLFTSPHHEAASGSGHLEPYQTQYNRSKHIPPFNQSQLQSTPVRSGLFGGGLHFEGSPLTPLPSTPHPGGSALSRGPGMPTVTSVQEVSNATNKQAVRASSSSGSLAGASHTSPLKSRIPVPSSSSLSRLPRPSSSLSLHTLATAGPSSPVKPPSRRSPVRSKARTRGKARSGVRSKAPVTRLAAKRGVQRTSSSFTGLRVEATLAGSNAPPPSPCTAEPSNPQPNIRAPETKARKSLVASPLLSAKNPPMPGSVATQPPSNSASRSPKKPTPLNALSTALQKLLVNPPVAPPPRPRPSTSLGLTRPCWTPTHASTLHLTSSQDDANVGTNAPEGSGRSPVTLQRSKTSLGHSAPGMAHKGLGKMGLPLRRPTVAPGNGRLEPGAGAPFASKQTNLSTVLASPSRSAVSRPDADQPSTPRNVQAEVLDVDTWVSPNHHGSSKAMKTKEEAKHVEYLIPLAAEPSAKRRPSPELVSPSRRASQASISLTQSLSLPRGPAVLPQARSASTSTAAHIIPRTPVRTRGRTKPPPSIQQPAAEGSTTAKPLDPMGGKRSNARMPGCLDVLRDCVIFVDVRTEEGEDAAALFIDMLRGLGARILAKPGKSCTHLIYKAGLPSTVTKYKLLQDPRPLVVSIGWVVECVEKRAHVEETRFLVNLNEIGVAGGVQRRRSMQPKQMRTLTLGQLESGEPADISVRADSSFTSEEPSTSGLILATLSPPVRSPHANLPPLERARQRSLRLPQE